MRVVSLLVVVPLVSMLVFQFLSFTCQADEPIILPDSWTLGCKVVIGYELSPSLKARLSLNGLAYDAGSELDGVRSDVDLKRFDFGGSLVYQPLSTGFRISGGMCKDHRYLDAITAVRTDDMFVLGGTGYPLSKRDDHDGQVELSNFAPFFDIGWFTSLGSSSNVYLSLDVCALYRGAAQQAFDKDSSGRFPGFREYLQDGGLVDDEAEGSEWYPLGIMNIHFRF